MLGALVAADSGAAVIAALGQRPDIRAETLLALQRFRTICRASKLVFDGSGCLSIACDRCCSLLVWFQDLASCHSKGYVDPRQCNNIVSKLDGLLSTPTGWAPTDTYLGDFKNSKLLKSDGDCMKMLREGSRKEGEKTLGALWAAVRDHIVQLKESPSWSKVKLQQVVGWEVQENLWGDALKWASMAVDTKCHHQISVFHILFKTYRSCAVVEELLRQLFGEGTKATYKEQKMCLRHVNLVKDVRANVVTLKSIMESEGASVAFEGQGDDPQHFVFFEPRVKEEIAAQVQERIYSFNC